jgi:hypothetical protein
MKRQRLGKEALDVDLQSDEHPQELPEIQERELAVKEPRTVSLASAEKTVDFTQPPLARGGTDEVRVLYHLAQKRISFFANSLTLHGSQPQMISFPIGFFYDLSTLRYPVLRRIAVGT